MAKVYYQTTAGFKLINAKNPAFKSSLSQLEKFTNIYLETDDGVFRGQVMLKIVTRDPDEYQAAFNILAGNKNTTVKETEKFNTALFTSTGLTIKLYRSGGGFANVIDSEGNAVTSKTPTTAQQEDAIRFILECGANYPTKEEINKHVGFSFGKDWHESFEKTYNAIITVISKSNLSQYNYYRDSNKNKIDFLNKITDEKILPDKKDNWNPSDIWAVKRSAESRLNSEVQVLYRDIKEKKLTFEALNSFVYEKFQSKDLVGISLKKVSSATAKIIKVETDTSMVDNLKFIGPTTKFEYNTTNSYFDFLFDFKFYKDVINYRFRFRPRAASGQLKTYGEGQAQTSKTFDGAISSDYINTLFPTIAGWIKYCEASIPIKGTVRETILNQPQDKDFAAFIKDAKFEFVKVNGLDTVETDPYKIRRACVLLYYIWKLESVSGRENVYKKMFLAAKKLNEFSSIHYKVS